MKKGMVWLLALAAGLCLVASSTFADGSYHQWRNPGGDPYRGDFKLAMKMFSLPEAVKKLFAEEFAAGRKTKYTLKEGDVFVEQLFGTPPNAKVAKNVVVGEWGPRATTHADLYEVEWGNKKYKLYLPDVCNNWSWQEEVLPPKPPVPVMAPPPVTRREPAPKPVGRVFIPPTSTPAPEKKAEMNWLTDMSVGAFSESFQDGNSVSGQWAVAALYFHREKGQWYAGPYVDHNGWDGTTGTGYEYQGQKWTAGLAVRYLTSGSMTEFRLGAGKRSDIGSNVESTGVYESEQDTTIGSAYLSTEFYGNGTWFTKNKIFLYGDFDLGGTRDDTWTDATGTSAIGTAPEDQSMIAGGFNTEVLVSANRNLALGAGVSAMHYNASSNTGIRAEVGVYAWKRMVEVNGYYTDWSDGANSTGVTVTVNLSSLLRKL